MNRALLTALLVAISLPVSAQQSVSSVLTTEQVTAFNQAVAEFKTAQEAQQANDNATAAAKYTVALPAIREVVKAQPDNIDNIGFLANALYSNAAVQIALQKPEQGLALMEESIPHWRKVVEAKPEDLGSQKVLVSILTQLANVQLSKEDKVGAAPLYDEAVTFGRKLVQSAPDAENKNLLLSAMIGASQTSEDQALKNEVTSMAKAMIADGSVSVVNRPAAEAISGQATAE